MPPDIDSLPPLREVIARHGLGARRSLGQNFLLDLNLTDKIARQAGDLASGTTIEVGPGPGGLTRSLLNAGARRLIVIEKDRRCLAALQEIAACSDGRMEILSGDALDLSLPDLGTTPRRVVANLPYNVSTVLLIAWLKVLTQDPQAFESLTLMFQKEVAGRLQAQPGSKDYGRLSVLTQWLTEPRILFDLPPRAFTPPPKVTSSVVAIVPRPQPVAPARLEILEQVTAAAFGQRRKMLRQSLKGLGMAAAQLIESAGVSETARAEELDIAQFCRLAQVLEASRQA